MPWTELAKCRGSHIDFFPTDGSGLAAPLAVCKVCPVIVECLEYALAHRIDHGVWGGLSERARRRLARTLGRLIAA